MTQEEELMRWHGARLSAARTRMRAMTRAVYQEQD